MDKKNPCGMDRRQFLGRMGMGYATALSLMALHPLRLSARSQTTASTQTGTDAPEGGMTYRIQRGTGEKISLLGFGMMRLPREQEEVDRLVDYAIAHGVNYFDTAPV